MSTLRTNTIEPVTEDGPLALTGSAVTLAPAGITTGRVNFGTAGAMGSAGWHYAGDDLPQTFPASGLAGELRAKNATTGSFVSLTEYTYGALLSIKNPAPNLEIWATNGTTRGWGPIATFVAEVGANTFELRNTYDTNALRLRLVDSEGVVISTDAANTPLDIIPNGDLTLGAHGTITIEPSDPNTSIFLSPTGTGGVEIGGGTAANPALRFQSTASGIYAIGNQIGLAAGGLAAGLIDTISGAGGLYIAAQGTNQDVSINGSGTGGVRLNHTVAIKGVRTNTAALDFGSIAAGGNAALTISVPGAAVGDSVIVNIIDAGGPYGGLVAKAWVSAADTVTVENDNYTAGSIDPASQNYRVTVITF